MLKVDLLASSKFEANSIALLGHITVIRTLGS